MKIKALLMGPDTLAGMDARAWTGLYLRLFAGGVMFPHGAQKLLGWFNGFGFSNTMAYFTESAGLPWIIGFLVILLESIGSLLIIAGLGTRFFSASLLVVMLGIIQTAQWENGFFMNWFGNQPGEGYEFSLLLIGLLLALIVHGPGKWSVDEKLK